MKKSNLFLSIGLLFWASVTLAGPISFEKYIRLSRGMSESDLIDTAGVPDRQVLRLGSRYGPLYDSVYDLVWTADIANPCTTTITIMNGKVHNIVREKKM